MPDMLVKLYELPPSGALVERLANGGIQIRRAMAPDKVRVLSWIEEHSSISARGEADVCFSHTPISLFIATEGKTIVGYACYDATAPNFFGPTRVLDEKQGQGIGKALLLACLEAMRAAGFAYAIIGGVGPAEFYTKTVGAVVIEGSTPGIYRDFLGSRLVISDPHG
ncbi:MAG TPA: GNAT family N-acetyltransferase [Sphaerochaeta sp.]|jgi:GNAT superfamily N-acetyltransferase|nr:GNAT family N-acetyltransferase [Spirochaetota bacterium]HPY11209.1 GNAT family N-acetyltransferase [Sphaerochaeta sp.]HQB89663.1 GNAT family N-acetyltransferase [Sphaerochaeta sp.]